MLYLKNSPVVRSNLIRAFYWQLARQVIFNAQLHQAPEISAIDDPSIKGLIAILHAHRKGLEQEILINQIHVNKID